MKSITRVVLLVSVLVSACSEPAETPANEIRSTIEAAVLAAEQRELKDMGDLLHEHYRDQQGYDKKHLVGLLQAYFFRHKNIHLFTRINEIELLTDNQAVVRLHVAMAGRVISDIDAVSSLRARLYEFELALLKDERWLFQHASWKPANIADLQ